MLRPNGSLPRTLWIGVRRGTVIMLALLAWALPTITWAQKVSLGPDFRVNTYTYGDQGGFRGADVASDAAGGFVVVWQRRNYASSVGQRFSSEGVPLGGEFFVNSVPGGYYEEESAYKPEVASDAVGNFVVVWESRDCDGSWGVCAQRFDSAGAKQGAEFKVSTAFYHYEHNPKIASDADGNFVIVWVDYPYILGRRFDSTGTPLGTTEFQVNTYTTYCCGCNPPGEDSDIVEIASDAAGNFMVVWNRWGSDAVFGRAFDSAGLPTGPEFEVASGEYYYCAFADVDAAGAGRFVVVWSGYYGDQPIRGRHFDSAGTPVGAEFEVNESTEGYFERPKVATDATGNFVVVWEDYYSAVGRQFDSTGTPVGAEFQVNSSTTFLYLDWPAVASAADGNFVVVWQADYDRDEDIFGRRFGDPEQFGCSPAPMEGCKQQTMERRGGLTIKDKDPDLKDRLRWKWVRGGATDLEDFGDPLDEANEYAMCIYDASGSPQPLSQQLIPGGGDCPGRPCWKQVGAKRFDYRNRNANGLVKVFLKAAEDGRARIGFTGRGADVVAPHLPLEPPVTVQFLASTGKCWESHYSGFVRKNEEGVFRAKPD